jgi:hypothetical protein
VLQECRRFKGLERELQVVVHYHVRDVSAGVFPVAGNACGETISEQGILQTESCSNVGVTGGTAEIVCDVDADNRCDEKNDSARMFESRDERALRDGVYSAKSTREPWTTSAFAAIAATCIPTERFSPSAEDAERD